MEQGYPIFRVYEPTKEEKELENRQRSVLEKLSEKGYGIKIDDDFYMDMPCRLDNNNFPLEIYHLVNNEPNMVQIFHKWEEVEKFASTIN